MSLCGSILQLQQRLETIIFLDKHNYFILDVFVYSKQFKKYFILLFYLKKFI